MKTGLVPESGAMRRGKTTGTQSLFGGYSIPLYKKHPTGQITVGCFLHQSRLFAIR